ncbi:helix-turn-helix domain-containing protein [Lysinibacillus xylanilyticus]|uniref:helix-turn-helix domain-containing protein n=1 Tax=Lysinibacillus xylanilyticus TaxID=582475 RepID=UPI003CFBD9F9
MIRNRLAALMAERGLKITRVAKDTGISRNTITAISQNDSEMMRMETINTLCKYLGVTPSEFYEYEPLDIDFFVEINFCRYSLQERPTDSFITENYLSITTADIDVIMDVKRNQHTQSFDLLGKTINSVELGNSDIFGANIPLTIEFDNENEKYIFINEIYNKISASFHQDIYKNLENKLNHELQSYLIKKINEDTLDNDDIFQKNLEKGIQQSIKVNLQSDVFKKF